MKQLLSQTIENDYDSAVVSNATVPRYNGLYVGEEGWRALSSSSSVETSSTNSSESSTSSVSAANDDLGFYGYVDVTNASIEAANGRYTLDSFPGNVGDPLYDYPYIELTDGGEDRVNGIYVPEEAWDTARLVYQDLSLPFPNIKVEGATKYTLDGVAIEEDPFPDEGSSSSSSSSDTAGLIIDYNGIYVSEQNWTEAKETILGVGAPDPQTILTWETTDGSNVYPVWRKVDSNHDLAMFHAGTLWDGWVMGRNMAYVNSAYYGYKMRHGYPTITWFNHVTTGVVDNPTIVRSEEFYTDDKINITRWQGGGNPVLRKVDNVDMELFVELNTEGNDEWQVGLYETESILSLYWAAYSTLRFPDRFYGDAGKDPGPRAAVFNIPSLQGDIGQANISGLQSGGQVIWKNDKNNGFYMYKDMSPWVADWVGWFIGRGTDHQENYYWSEPTPGVTDTIPPSQWFLDYYAENTLATPIAVRYPLDWTIEGRPILRKWQDPAFALSTGTYPFNNWYGWWLGKGADNGVNAMYWAEDNACFVPDLFYVSNDGVDTDRHFYDEFLPEAEKITAAQLPIVESSPKLADCVERTITSNRVPGIETFRATSLDKLLDTENFHQIAFTWGKHFNAGFPTLYIDGLEVSGYEVREYFEGTLPWLNQTNEYPLTWAPLQIGRTCGITESSSCSDSSCPSTLPMGGLMAPLTGPTPAALGAEGPWSGSSLGSPWPQLKQAIADLQHCPQQFKLTISTMLPGNIASDHNHENQTTRDVRDYGSGPLPVDHRAFQKQVCDGLLEWKKAFEAIYNTANGYPNDLTFIIEDLLDEGPGAPPSTPSTPSYLLPSGASNVGDVRVCMIPIDGPSSILAFAFSPGQEAGAVGSLGGDIRFDPDEDWRPDGSAEGGAISIMYVAAHEFGHAMGIGHDQDPTSLMFPALQNQTDNFIDLWPTGLVDSPADCRSIQEVYGFADEYSSSASLIPCESSSESSSYVDVCSNPGWYLDATLDELMLFASWLLPQQLKELNDHLIEGVQDGDRWLINDRNIRVVTGNKLIDERDNELVGDQLSDLPPRESVWALHKNHIAEWRRDPVTGELGWTYIPTEFSAVFWNQERGRLDSFLPDEYFELYGDYGVTGTGDFSVG